MRQTILTTYHDIMFSSNTLITGGTFNHVQLATIGAIKIYEGSN